MSKLSIHVKQIDIHQSNGLDASWLKLEFGGSDINVKMINTLRRVATNALPTYAWCKEMIKIETNTMVAFNNDYMRLRLSLLPVMGCSADISFLPEKYWYKTNYADPKREKHSSEQLVEAYINTHNNSASILPITTNDLKIYVDGEEVKPYSEQYPILIAKLKPDDRFKCSLKAALGVGELDAVWDSARNVFYDYDDNLDEDKRVYEFTIEGGWQIHEYLTLYRATEYILKKLDDLKNELSKKFSTNEITTENLIFLTLEKEDHTFGELLNYEFQDHPNIIASGISKPDHLVKTVLIKITSDSKKHNPSKSIIECLDKLTDKFTEIGKQIKLLGKSYMSKEAKSYDYKKNKQ
jgi:DNA-directed RNA polymerase subunit L